ncbi:hypothetical protein [Erwinia tracheiphila]|nr:hypothetical protein [Erwinia tracheiphila]
MREKHAATVVLSGVVAEYFGWRIVFAAALMVTFITLLHWLRLP